MPVILIIALGSILRHRNVLAAQTVEQLKKLVVTVALPAVLFGAFLEMKLEREFLGLFAVILVLCLVMFVYGFVLRRIIAPAHDYYPFLMTGFEFGMVGITLFGSAYGLANVGYIAIVDLSHELFIWFVFATILTARRDGSSSLAATLRGFLTSPIIISIVSALLLNILGLGIAFSGSVAGGAVMETLGILGNLLIPSILIIIGYGTHLTRVGLRDAAGVVITRYAVLVPLGLVVSRWVVRELLRLDPAFEVAVFTFFILPPPYIVPLFISPGREEERTYANNVLSVYTVVSLIIFVIYFLFNPTLG